jgi:hypothetical protein
VETEERNEGKHSERSGDALKLRVGTPVWTQRTALPERLEQRRAQKKQEKTQQRRRSVTRLAPDEPRRDQGDHDGARGEVELQRMNRAGMAGKLETPPALAR